MSHSSSEPIYLSDNTPTNAELRRGKAILNSSLLSDAGRHWLVRAVDPYHDTNVKPYGYPDMDNSATVIQEINLSTSISRPSTVAAGANWDCHIFNMCDFAFDPSNANSVLPTQFNPYTGIRASTGTATYAGGGLQILSAGAGAAMLPSGGTTTVSATTQSTSINPWTYVSSKARVVGWAFEVVNTTAEVYKQGLCTAYRMPQTDQIMNTINICPLTAGGSSWDVTAIRCHLLPPSSVQKALILPGSKQWNAAEGYYGVCTLRCAENPFVGLDNLSRMYHEADVLSSSGNQSAIFTPIAINASAATSAMYPVFSAPFNTTGAYFTGLSSDTTLQINMKIILESAPGPNSTLATLAEPSPSYDPEALRIYSNLVSELPVGVPFTQNPDGEWFRTVLGTLGHVATAASAINPLFGLLGQGLGIAADVAPSIVKMFKSEKKPKNNALKDKERDLLERSKTQTVKNQNAPSNLKRNRPNGVQQAPPNMRRPPRVSVKK
jgi:hypothetical protein